MYFLLGISLTLAFLLVVNMAAAGGSLLAWRLCRKRIEELSSSTQSQVIFAMRVMPVTVSIVIAIAFIVPAYLINEPADSGEIVSGKLGALAILSMIAVIFAASRVLRTWLSTRRLISNWLSNSVEIELPIRNLKVHRITHAFPVIAVVGAFRPRLFLADTVASALDQDELNAAWEHETGHLRSFDNLKRSILRLCRDLSLVPVGTDLERAWSRSAEAAADEYAARSGPDTALHLASALVKILKIASPSPAGHAASSLVGDEDGDVSARIRRLVVLSTCSISPENEILGFSPTAWVWTASLICLLFLPVADRTFYLTTHEAIESIVRILN